jgi:hypothetical protein
VVVETEAVAVADALAAVEDTVAVGTVLAEPQAAAEATVQAAAVAPAAEATEAEATVVAGTVQAAAVGVPTGERVLPTSHAAA